MIRPRPKKLIAALARLDYKPFPARGDHKWMIKKIVHSGKSVTIKTGIDMGQKQCGRSDVDRIQNDTKLQGEMWERALKKKLPVEEYEAHLLSLPRSDLVLPFWRDKID